MKQDCGLECTRVHSQCKGIITKTIDHSHHKVTCLSHRFVTICSVFESFLSLHITAKSVVRFHCAVQPCVVSRCLKSPARLQCSTREVIRLPGRLSVHEAAVGGCGQSAGKPHESDGGGGCCFFFLLFFCEKKAESLPMWLPGSCGLSLARVHSSRPINLSARSVFRQRLRRWLVMESTQCTSGEVGGGG